MTRISYAIRRDSFNRCYEIVKLNGASNPLPVQTSIYTFSKAEEALRTWIQLEKDRISIVPAPEAGFPPTAAE